VPADKSAARPDAESRAGARNAGARNDAVVNLSKRRGFVYPSSEIYGGTRSAWDYGPLGVELKENVRQQWWKTMVTSREDIVGIDSAVILAPQVWQASGHVETFHDPLTECTHCHFRFRADQLEEEFETRKGRKPEGGLAEIPCPNCGTRGQWTEPKHFSGMLRTYLGPVEDETALHYLRPETAQGIFVNFLNVLNTSRKKPPFGIAQTGKSFRNEITPGNFIFRTREFEQMEMEFFVAPSEDEKWFDYWLEQRWNWYVDLGIDPDNLRYFEHPKDKLSHYSKRTVDIEYRFGFGGTEFAELEGIANRTDFDLTTHKQHSGVDLSYFDQASGERYVPYVIEPAAGLTRAVLAFLLDAYAEDEAPDAKGKLEKRTVLRIDKRLAPVKVAVLPLSRNPDLSPKARGLAAALRRNWNVEFDDAQAIGRRYRRQDEIGTPFCVTVDFDTLDDNAVTVRERDSMKQERISLDRVESYLAAELPGC
jgi:glycyl-tRNA synthetase